MLTSGQVNCSSFNTAYHPFLWWARIGEKGCQPLAEVAIRVFFLTISSSGVERSFKIRSRVHSKSRVQLSDWKADQQSSVIYNTNQIKWIDNGVLATRRGRWITQIILNGVSSPNNTERESSTLDKPDDLDEEVDVDIAFDETEAFVSISDFADNLDTILCKNDRKLLLELQLKLKTSLLCKLIIYSLFPYIFTLEALWLVFTEKSVCEYNEHYWKHKQFVNITSQWQ